MSLAAVRRSARARGVNIHSIFTDARRIGLAAVRRSREVDGVNTLHSMFPLAPEGLEWSDRGVNIHSQFSEASGRLCGGSEIVRGRGVNVHSMFPVAPEGLEWSDRGRGVNFHSQFYEAPDRLCGGSENLFVYLSLWYGRLYSRVFYSSQFSHSRAGYLNWKRFCTIRSRCD